MTSCGFWLVNKSSTTRPFDDRPEYYISVHGHIGEYRRARGWGRLVLGLVPGLLSRTLHNEIRERIDGCQRRCECRLTEARRQAQVTASPAEILLVLNTA